MSTRKSIYFLFTSSPTFYSRLIRLITGSKWSHVEIIYRGRAISAIIGKGVREISVMDLVSNPKDKTSYTIGWLPGDPEQMWEFAQKELGKKYDLKGLILAFFRIHQPNYNKWFCSELAAAGLAQQGIRTGTQLYKYATPGDIYRACKILVSLD